jgi:hypothetical protein
MKTSSTPRLLLAAAALAASPQSAVYAQPHPNAVAETPQEAAAAALVQRTQSLPALLSENGELTTAFTPEFFAAVPLPRLEQVLADLRRQYGAPVRVSRFDRTQGSNSGTAIIAYDRADVTIVLAVDASGRIAGLRITDAVMRDDSLQALTAELAALPGEVGWGMYRLHRGAGPERIAGHAQDEHLAVGSSFKLVVLAALDVEISAGRVQWADVIALDYPSVPSGMIQDWPIGTPLTIQTAAQLMIANSDNTATDLLIRHIGRETIEAFARTHGGLSGPRAFPMLTTIEATVLKNPALTEARQGWLNGNEAQRRAVLSTYAQHFRATNVDYGAFALPADIDRIEWFASSDSMARLLSWFAHDASDTARAILAVNPGMLATSAARWTYVGYKGGSEPGVVALNFLLRNAQGESFALVMSWNNGQASVDESRLSALAARAATLVNQQAVH